jgi:hypothetical protein
VDKLPLNRVKSKEQESLYSFLYRLAIKNGYDHLGSMFTELKSAAYAENCNEVHPSLYWVDFITSLLEGLNLKINSMVTNQFDHLFFRREKEKLLDRRNNFRKFYHRYATKYCPKCIQEDFYHQINWDLSYVTVCTKHNVSLITVCSKCNNVIRMSRLLRDECKCGQKYTKIRAQKPDSITIDVQKNFQSILTGITQEIKRTDGSYIGREEYLDYLFLFRQVIENLDISNFSLSDHYKIKNKLSFGETNVTYIDRNKFNFIVSTLHSLITDPDMDLGNMIKSLDDKKKGKEYLVVSRNNKYRKLREIFELEKGKFYYEVYSDILYNKKDEYINQRFMLPPLKKDEVYITMGKALSLLKTEHNTVKNLCEYNLIKQHVTYNDGKKVTLIEKASIDEYQKMKNSSFTLDQATKYLGLNFRQMKELLDLKVIQATHGPGVDGYSLWYISKSEIYHFEKELKRIFLPLTSVKGKEGLTIKQVSFKLRRDSISIGEIYQLCLIGRLRVFFDGNPRLIDGIKFLTEDVEKLVKELYYKRIDDKGYRGKEIERACMCGQNTVKQLLEDKILKIDLIVEDGKNPPKKFITKQQIIVYLKKYKNMSKRQINEHLNAIEISFEPSF